MRESKFERDLIKEIELLFPGCVIIKNDANLLQGFCDRLILYGPKWAALEVKVSEGADRQPNQEYYVGLLDSMSYASFVYPENKEQVLDELQRALRPGRSTRISFR